MLRSGLRASQSPHVTICIPTRADKIENPSKSQDTAGSQQPHAGAGCLGPTRADEPLAPGLALTQELAVYIVVVLYSQTAAATPVRQAICKHQRVNAKPQQLLKHK